MNPLHPLSYGNVLIVGVKASNLNDEIRDNPRVVIWDSQQEHWTNKEMPTNTRAVFMTRFVSHNTSAHLLKEARKKRITIFNPEGTGIIIRQVKELLNMQEPKEEPKEKQPKQETIPMVTEKKIGPFNKLKVLVPFINFDKNNRENAKILLPKCKELGFESTFNSLAYFVGNERKKKTLNFFPKKKKEINQVDVSVEILDGMIKELQDMREFLVAVTKENQSLKAKVDKFKRFFDE